MQPLLIVFSHVRWSPAGSRPQHLLSRLAGRWQVIYIEEPRPGPSPGPATLLQWHHDSHLSVLVPQTPLSPAGFHDDQLGTVLPLLKRHLAATARQPDAAWLTTPMALPLAQALKPGRIVYDCMEPLAELEHAPRQIAQRERALMKQADLVFAAGPSLYSERQADHPAMHCLPNAVDAAHFALGSPAAGPPALGDHDIGRGPRVGFHGVIDERIDLGLVAAVAEAHPDWTVEMAGPVHAPLSTPLPQRDNLHWSGPWRYEDLPALLASWDLALMPFVLSPANRLANPLQTLEYLAADLPVVSTPLRDVDWLYGEAVSLAAPGAAGFLQACEQTLAESASARYRRSLAAMSIVASHSWDRSADTVDSLLLGALDEQGRREHAPLRLVSAERRA